MIPLAFNYYFVYTLYFYKGYSVRKEKNIRSMFLRNSPKQVNNFSNS
jgi:hypothetical protein